jgi:hypothetical protein
MRVSENNSSRKLADQTCPAELVCARLLPASLDRFFFIDKSRVQAVSSSPKEPKERCEKGKPVARRGRKVTGVN